MSGGIILLQAVLTVAVTIPVLVIAYMAVYRPAALDTMIEVTFKSERTSLADDSPPPAYHPRRAWRIAFLVAGIAGVAYMLYGAAVQLLVWMPYDWRGAEGEWLARTMGGLLAMLALFPVMTWAGVLWRKARQHDELVMFDQEIVRGIAKSFPAADWFHPDFYESRGTETMLCVVYESPPYQDGDNQHGWLPLFGNEFSRRVGPMPHFPFRLRGGTFRDSTTLLMVDGEVSECNANFSATVANKNIVSRGWGRWVPEGLDVTQDANKLWLLGRKEFAPRMSAEERAAADDPWLDGEAGSVWRTYVPQGNTERYLIWKQGQSAGKS